MEGPGIDFLRQGGVRIPPAVARTLILLSGLRSIPQKAKRTRASGAVSVHSPREKSRRSVLNEPPFRSSHFWGHGRKPHSLQGRYQQLRAAYDRDYATLMRRRSVVSTWEAEDRRGGIGSAAEVDREKVAVAATRLLLRRTQFLLERVQNRLLRLKRLHDQGHGRGTIAGGVTTT